MNTISIRWSDSKTYKTVTHRKQKIKRLKGGWVINDGSTVYHCIDCAMNAIDVQKGIKKRAKRMDHGIHMIN